MLFIQFVNNPNKMKSKMKRMELSVDVVLSFLFFTFLKRNKIISWKIGSVIMSLSNMISSGVIITVFAYVFVTDH